MIPMAMKLSSTLPSNSLTVYIPKVLGSGQQFDARFFDDGALKDQKYFLENNEALLIVGGRHSIIKALRDMSNGTRCIWVGSELMIYLDRKLGMKEFLSRPQTYTIIQLCELNYSPGAKYIRFSARKGVRNSPNEVLLESLANVLEAEFAIHFS